MRFTGRKFSQCVLLWMTLFLLIKPGMIRAQSTAPATAGGSNARSGSIRAELEKDKAHEADEPENKNEFRHSAAVTSISKLMGTDVETAAKIFEYANFAIVVFAIVIPLVKYMPRAFKKRRETLATQLAEARTETQSANERLGAVEQRLAKLDDEIAGFRRQVEQDMQQDEARMKEQIELERIRIVEEAAQEVANAGAQIRRDLRKVAAEMAVERAKTRIRISADTDHALINDFLSGMPGAGKGEQN